LHLALERFTSMDHDETIVSWQDICRHLAGTIPEVLLKPDADGNTPLHMAGFWRLLHSSNNHMSTIMQVMLIDKEQKVLTHQNKHGRTALHVVDIVNFRSCLPFLINHHEEVLRTQDGPLQTPLHCCIRSHTGGVYEIVQLLICNSERVLIVEDNTGSLPLHAALQAGISDIATLVSLLGKVNSAFISQKKNLVGLKPISLAISNSADIEIVQILLALG